ncbi:MAG: MFS transporter [Planctomycetes bacterium]|nr:MFS transporter [Planctomycetota bacterium]
MMRPATIHLCVMMFLQFFVWGAWYVTLGNFLGKHGWGDEVGAAYGLCPIAAMISPLFLGMVADRFFATQRVLGALHLLGAVILALVASIAADGSTTPRAFLWSLMAYALVYMPTLGLANTLAFHHITDQALEFPLVRVFGTLGWIAAGTLVSLGLGVDQVGATLDQAAVQYWIAAGASALLGVYGWFLPHTPPPAAGRTISAAESLGLGSLVLLKNPSFLTFILCSFLTCIPLMAYYTQAPVFVGQSGFANPGFVMSFGQWVEVVFMLLMPMMFLRFGVKWMLAAGVLAWVLRYGLFSFGAGETAGSSVGWMIVLGILLHGICYDFFFVTGQIYVDKVAPPTIRGQAQGFLVLMTLGLGSFVGSHATGTLVARYTPSGAEANEKQATAISERIAPLLKQQQEGARPLDAAQRTELSRAESERDALLAAARKDWQAIWRWPALGAAAVLLAFLLLFRHRE